MKKKKNILENKVVFRLACILSFGLINSLCKTVRLFEYNKEKYLEVFDKGLLFFIWHRTLMVPIYANKNMGISTLAALSPDGSLQTHICEKYGYKVYRGSSKRHGVQGLFNIMKGIARKESVALTVDGPIGPAEKCQPGAALMVRKSGYPFIAVGVAIDKKWVFEKSWDGFQIPKFGAKAYVYYSDPIIINNDLTQEEILKLIENSIHDATKKAESLLKDSLNGKKKETT